MVISLKSCSLRLSLFFFVRLSFYFAFIVLCLIWINGFVAPAGKDMPDSPLKTMHSSVRKMKIHDQMNAKSLPFSLGPFGLMMVDMMGIDLPFTLFVPSESCLRNLFSRQKIASNDQQQTLFSTKINTSQATGANDEIYAILSRIVGFSAVPKPISPKVIPVGGELEVESISGYKLYLSKDVEKGFLINNLVWEPFNFKRGQLMVHLVDGVLMDYEFERSIFFEDIVEEDDI